MGTILDSRTRPARFRHSRALGDSGVLLSPLYSDAPNRIVALAADHRCRLDDARDRYHRWPLLGFIFDRISLYGCYPCDPSVLPDSYLERPARSGMVKGTHHQGPHTGHYSWDGGTINNPEPRSRSSTTQESR